MTPVNNAPIAPVLSKLTFHFPIRVIKQCCTDIWTEKNRKPELDHKRLHSSILDTLDKILAGL